MIAGIEDKTYAELKAQRDELVVQVVAFAGVDPDELARHYLHARMDAAQRDEKLAEQGKTITALQDGAEASKQQDTARIERLGQCTMKLAAVQDELKLVRETAADQAAASAGQINTLRAQCVRETERADRLKALSSISRAAVVQAAAILNTAASQMTVEAADQGE